MAKPGQFWFKAGPPTYSTGSIQLSGHSMSWHNCHFLVRVNKPGNDRSWLQTQTFFPKCTEVSNPRPFRRLHLAIWQSAILGIMLNAANSRHVSGFQCDMFFCMSQKQDQAVGGNKTQSITYGMPFNSCVDILQELVKKVGKPNKKNPTVVLTERVLERRFKLPRCGVRPFLGNHHPLFAVRLPAPPHQHSKLKVHDCFNRDLTNHEYLAVLKFSKKTFWA